MASMITVAVTSVGGGVGQSILEALRYSPLPVRTVGTDVCPMSAGLYWTNAAWLVPPARDEERYIRALLRLCERENIDVLIPGADPELTPLARHREVFAERGCTVIVSAPEAVVLAQDKLGLYCFCRGRGLAYVPTRTIAEAEAEADGIRYPVIVKPLHGSGSVGARLVHNPEDLRRLARNAVEEGHDLIVQRYLPPRPIRPGESLLDSTGRLDQSNEISAQFIVSRQGNILGSYVSANRLKDGVPVEIVPDMDSPAAERARAFVEALIPLGLRGPINVQGRMTPSGAFFFELNPRFTGITCVRSAMGFREVDAVLLDFLERGEEEARRCLDYHPGNIALRFVELNVVPAAAVDGVKSVLLEEADRATVPPGQAGEGPAEATRKPVKPSEFVKLEKVAVTGASGYVGRALLDELLDGEGGPDVLALTGSPASAEDLRTAYGADPRLKVRPDLPDDFGGELDGVQVVFHLAADRGVSGDSDTLFRTNVEYTRRLLSLLRRAGVGRMVLLSSQSVYGRARPIPWAEDLPPAPETPYAVSKRMAEELALNPTLVGLPDVAVLRSSRIFGVGERMRWGEVQHLLALRAVSGENLVLHGSGEQLLDLVHVRDVVSGLLAGAQFVLGGGGSLVVNVGGGRWVRVLDLARAICAAARDAGFSPGGIEHMEVPEDVDQRSYGLDVRAALRRLGWAPRITLEDAAAELIEAARKV